MKKRHNTSDQPIPFDLMIETFTRLPTKSLARFRCLSKLYASTIVSPNFTDSFFTISSSRPKLLFTVFKDCKMFFFSSPSPQPQNPSQVTADIHMSFSINCRSQIPRPVNGLVCGLSLRNGKSRIANVPLLCNPGTGQFLTLPRVKTKKPQVISYLGYDPSEKQFKVLCMTMPSVRFPFSKEHQVLTLETGKRLSWRMIKFDIPHSPINVDYWKNSQKVYDGICINGVFYYLALISLEGLHDGYPDIVCFDIKSEKFSFIKMAHDGGMDIRPGSKIIESTLVNYKGKLAKLQPNTVGQLYIGIQLWVLEDAEKHEWLSYIYVLPPPWKYIVAETKLCFVGTTGTGEIVLSPNSLSNSFYLLYYNPEKNTITKVGIQGMEAFQSEKAYTLLDNVEDVKLMAYGPKRRPPRHTAPRAI